MQLHDAAHLVPRLVPTVDVVADAGYLTPIAEMSLGPCPRGAVLILYAGDDREERDAMMNDLAAHGYESVALDTEQVDDSAHGIALALARLAERGWGSEQVGVVGFRAAAASALWTAATFTLGAAVSVDISVHAGAFPDVESWLGQLTTPWLGLAASRTPGGVGTHLWPRWPALRTVSAVHTEFVSYPAAAEGYSIDAVDVHSYAAAFDSWQRTAEWLDARVVPRLTARSASWRATLPGSAGEP